VRDYDVSRHRSTRIVTTKSRITLAIIVSGVLLTIGWLGLGAPSSVAEARFHYRLAKASDGPTATLDLSALMPGGWELVCSAHCYSGPFYLKEYDRTFPPVSACQDGSWGFDIHLRGRLL
jgi:hypothetical protein